MPRVLFVSVYALFSTIFLLSVIALFTVRNEIQKRKNEIKIGVVNGKHQIVGSMRFGKDCCQLSIIAKNMKIFVEIDYLKRQEVLCQL